MHTQPGLYDHIISKATELFRSYGFKSITVDDICRLCGISKKTFYTQFEHKDDLVHAVIEEELQEFAAALHGIRAQSADAVQELVLLQPVIQRLIRGRQPNRNTELERFYPRSFQQIAAFRRDELLAFLMRNLEKGMAEGLYLKGFNIQVIAGMRMHQLDSIINRRTEITADADIEEISRQLNCHYISGLSTPEGFLLLKKYTHTTQP